MRLQQESASENRSTLTPCASGCFPLREANGSPFLGQSRRWSQPVEATAMGQAAVAEITCTLGGCLQSSRIVGVDPLRTVIGGESGRGNLQHQRGE